MKRKLSIFTVCIYLILIGATLWQGFLLLRHSQPRYGGTDIAMIDITVEGNVRRPGRYRVARGTTQFEILQVAGVRPTSDLSMLSLTAQLDSSDELTVGTLEKAVGVSEEPLSVRLEFFFGEISIVSVDGRSVPQH